jgi:hypothetical protein
LHQSLVDEPPVGRSHKVALELLLERCERTVALRGEHLDGDIAEDVGIDYLLEIIVRRIDITQHLALKAAVLLRDNEIDQLGHLDILGCLVVHILVLKVGGRMVEETPKGRGSGLRDVIERATGVASVRIGDVNRIGHIQM